MCVCVCFCLCVCLHVRERDRQREKKAEKRSFAYVARGGYPFSDGSSQVQDVLSQIVRKHIWQGLVATLLWKAWLPLLPSATAAHWASGVCFKRGWYLQRPVNSVTPAGTVCREHFDHRSHAIKRRLYLWSGFLTLKISPVGLFCLCLVLFILNLYFFLLLYCLSIICLFFVFYCEALCEVGSRKVLYKCILLTYSQCYGG